MKKSYEVYFPVSGTMKVLLAAENKEEAVVEGYKIAKEIERDSIKEIVPNLEEWRVNDIKDVDHILVLERGEIDGQCREDVIGTYQTSN